MRILFISRDLIGGNVARLLKEEGHEVKLFIENKESRHNFDNLVPKTKDWKKELDWVGKDGLIVFDDVGYGAIQDQLRKKGYAVFGGSKKGELIEMDREYGQKIFRECGMSTVELKDFKNMDDAAVFIKENRGEWVLKTDNGDGKFYSYVGELESGEDVLSLLRNYLLHNPINRKQVTLHRRIRGIEIGVGRYFNGKDWVGPIEYNVEHVRFLAGDIGPSTSEMGTLAWYGENENNKLYQETLARMKPFLVEADYRGDFEINCIVNEEGVYPLEATARMGTPIVHLHTALHESPWGELLHAVATGKSFDLKYRKGYGTVLLMAVPPFPYSKSSKEHDYYGVRLHFKDAICPADFKNIHFEEVALSNLGENFYYISDKQGYILYVTGTGATIKEARENMYSVAQKIVIPKVMYRNDIGSDFENKERALLEKWGYLEPEPMLDIKELKQVSGVLK